MLTCCRMASGSTDVVGRAVAVIVSLPLAVAMAWLLAKRNFPGKFIVETIVNLPLVLPPVVTGYLLLVLCGRRER